MPAPTTLNSSPSTTEPSSRGTAGKAAFITTSWDDGHPLDFRLADLLARYDLPGTFYIPKVSQRPTMDEPRVRELSTRFDVGAHTLEHLALTTLSTEESRQQIEGCKQWVEGVIGRDCPVFCPPLGKYRREHLVQIRKAGFSAIRTVELMSLDLPRSVEGLAVMPTSLQAYPHRIKAYAKNAIRRRSPGNLARAVVHARGKSWPALCASLLEKVMRDGGVLHLWGHSWEIEETEQWSALEEAFGALSAQAGTTKVSNTELATILLGKSTPHPHSTSLTPGGPLP